MKFSLVSGFVIALVIALSGVQKTEASFLDKVKKTIDKELGGTSDSGATSGASSLGVAEVTEGLKEALKVGTETVVSQLGADGGYENDPSIHIPLPEKMQQAQKFLRQFGLSGMADEVETRLNEGAEAAAPKTKELIVKAINDMTLEDAKRIYDGPDDAATQYFRKSSTTELKNTIRPVIDQSLKDVGAIEAYNSLMGEYSKLPLVPNIKSDLTEHATDLALEGIFHYLAQEEAAIRNNPVKRTTEILQSVFGR